jgi:hypothetical protein
MAATTYSDEERICPYCGHSYQPESETHSEDAREEDCEKCGKTYMAYDSFSVMHYAVAIEPLDAAKES